MFQTRVSELAQCPNQVHPHAQMTFALSSIIEGPFQSPQILLETPARKRAFENVLALHNPRLALVDRFQTVNFINACTKRASTHFSHTADI